MEPAASSIPGHANVSGTGQTRQTGQREKFSAEELAIVLSHYDIGVVDSIVEYPRGSRKAPKLLIVSEQGKFLLKRRARGKDDPYKVAFCHALQLFLAGKQFPLPHLIGTRRRGGVCRGSPSGPGQPNVHQQLHSRRRRARRAGAARVTRACGQHAGF